MNTYGLILVLGYRYHKEEDSLDTLRDKDYNSSSQKIRQTFYI